MKIKWLNNEKRKNYVLTKKKTLVESTPVAGRKKCKNVSPPPMLRLL